MRETLLCAANRPFLHFIKNQKLQFIKVGFQMQIIILKTYLCYIGSQKQVGKNLFGVPA